MAHNSAIATLTQAIVNAHDVPFQNPFYFREAKMDPASKPTLTPNTFPRPSLRDQPAFKSLGQALDKAKPNDAIKLEKHDGSSKTFKLGYSSISGTIKYYQLSDTKLNTKTDEVPVSFRVEHNVLDRGGVSQTITRAANRVVVEDIENKYQLAREFYDDEGLTTPNVFSEKTENEDWNYNGQSIGDHLAKISGEEFSKSTKRVRKLEINAVITKVDAETGPLATRYMAQRVWNATAAEPDPRIRSAIDKLILPDGSSALLRPGLAGLGAKPKSIAETGVNRALADQAGLLKLLDSWTEPPRESAKKIEKAVGDLDLLSARLSTIDPDGSTELANHKSDLLDRVFAQKTLLEQKLLAVLGKSAGGSYD